jgi:hypothetical protein
MSKRKYFLLLSIWSFVGIVSHILAGREFTEGYIMGGVLYGIVELIWYIINKNKIKWVNTLKRVLKKED